MTRSATGRRRRALLALVLVLPTASCGSLTAPFEGVPRLPTKSNDPGDRVAVCYNKLFATPEQVRAVAIDACGPDATPQFLEQDERLACPLLTPVRATYQCLPD
jgi:hypothetical protein